MKLNEALEAFLLVNRTRQTQDTYKRVLTPFVLAIGPQRPLELIKPEDVNAYVQDMSERHVKYADHPKRPTVEESLAPATLYKIVKTIKIFFKWCVRQGYLLKSPAEQLIARRPKRPLGLGKAATDKELSAILAMARGKPRDYALVMLLARSGCRAGEAAGLQIKQLDLNNHAAMVDGKGERMRKIYFDEETSTALHEWLRRRPKVKHDYVFTAVNTKNKLSPRAISEVIRRLCRTAGLERLLGAHSLRHRVGLTFARARIAPRVAQHYLGHTNIVTTLEYYQDVDETDLRAAGKLLTGDD